ncbi:MAG: ParA family protein [Albidovulum sp.]|nr:ParA family protein [Albidovulum sp.]
MPTIVIASPTGGAGKTTAAVFLATEFARAGAFKTLLDCDPNHSASLWWSSGIRPSGIEVLSDVTNSNVVRTIKEHDRKGGVVICDLEGIASRLVSRAISQADLILIPMRATTLDTTVGIRTVALIQEEEEALWTGRSGKLCSSR